MKKENKKPLILWALVALVLGVILGLVITNLSTTGQAKSTLQKNQFINPDIDIYTSSQLRLNQWFNNVDDYYETQYFFYNYEYVESNMPATLYNQFHINSSNLNAFGNHSLLKLELNDSGTYSIDTTFSYVYIPFTQNNLTVDSSFGGRFVFADGRETYEQTYSIENPNEDAFAEVTAFDFGCNGQYQMTHTDVGNISNVHFYLNIETLNYEGFWEFDWDQTPQRNYNYMGYFPPEAMNILSDGSDYRVYLRAHILTNTNNITRAVTSKEINCQTGKSKGVSPENLEDFKNKINEKSIDDITLNKNKK